MAKRTHNQWDFSGGEISTRMLMRADTEVYQKSLLQMENFHPTLQGSAERSPGTRFVYDSGFTNLRLIPYLTPANEKAFVELGPENIKIQPNITDNLNNPGVLGSPDPTATVTIRKQIVENDDFRRSAAPWNLEPEQYTGGGGDLLGLYWRGTLGGEVLGIARIWKSIDIDTCTVTSTAEVDFPTNAITVAFRLEYITNFTPDAGDKYEAKVRIGTTPGGFDVMDFDFTGPPGTIADLVQNFALPGAPFTGTLYLTVYWKAIAPGAGEHSTPQFRLERFSVFADDQIDIGSTAVFGTAPWLYNEIDDVHFIQSPYSPPSTDPDAPSKQLVLVHPNHSPYQLFFNTNASLVQPPEYPNPGDIPLGYVLLRMEFTGDLAPVWSVGNYPNTCTSYKGRLILAGAQDAPTPGSPTSPETETVWGTKVGDWLAFSDTGEVDADDSIEFATIYRSPIQWVYGQKNLLVGALEMEYIASADGIFQPADLGVDMQSTHGANHVQPAGFGESVLYSAEGGTKVREMRYREDDQGWISPDVTLLHPELCSSGIKRMVRMRNPHQMCVCLLNDGQLAIYHSDVQAGISGWSRLSVTSGTRIIDICVVANSAGVDILYLAVRRNVEGTTFCFVEAIVDWTDTANLDYMSSSKLFIPETPTDTFTGLDHLNGVLAQVVADGNYIGSFLVSGGALTLVDDIGDSIVVNSALIGRTMPCNMQILPPAKKNPGAATSWESVSLRIRESIRPIINGIQYEDRSPLRIMGKSENLENFEDIEVMELGWSIYNTVRVRATTPLRVEVLGLYGEFSEESL